MATNQSSQNDLQRMQQEAIRRVQEMQARAASAQSAMEAGRPPPPRNPEPEPHRGMEASMQHTQRTAPPQKQENDGSPISHIFGSLLSDSERTLILILLLLLVSEDGDIGLVLALMYLVI